MNWAEEGDGPVSPGPQYLIWEGSRTGLMAWKPSICLHRNSLEPFTPAAHSLAPPPPSPQVEGRRPTWRFGGRWYAACCLPASRE